MLEPCFGEAGNTNSDWFHGAFGGQKSSQWGGVISTKEWI